MREHLRVQWDCIEGRRRGFGRLCLARFSLLLSEKDNPDTLKKALPSPYSLGDPRRWAGLNTIPLH